MKIDEIKKIASLHNIDPGKGKKSELVRAIQESEGHHPCFETNRATHCGQHDCIWREDCN
jgi:hypothetical protein